MTEIPSSLFSEFSHFVAAHFGLYFPLTHRDELDKAIRSAAVEFEFTDPRACVRWLLSSSPSRSQIEVLASHLTIGETFFFRDRSNFDALATRVLPALINARRHSTRMLRLWSAGCCTGEEAYSLAILLRDLLPDLEEWNCTILATDINPRFLQKAIQGTYGPRSFRDVPTAVRDANFLRHDGDRYEVLPAIRQMVTFSYLNLAQDHYPSVLTNTLGMDVILCRKVLMYFAPETVQAVVERLYGSLARDGCLLVAPCEASNTVFARFTPVNIPHCALYERHGVQPTTPAAPDQTPWPTRHIEGAVAEAEGLNPAARFLRAAILQEQGEIDGAVAALKRALELEPDYLPAQFALGNLLRRQGKLNESEKHFANALQLLRAQPLHEALAETDGMITGHLRAVDFSSHADF